jgi:hypothetical protein
MVTLKPENVYMNETCGVVEFSFERFLKYSYLEGGCLRSLKNKTQS